MHEKFFKNVHFYSLNNIYKLQNQDSATEEEI